MNLLRSLSLALLVLGCGTPVTPADAGGDGGSTTDAGGTGSVVVHVFEDDGATSIAGAVVALDSPSGARVELTSGADGIVRFEGLSWGSDAFDVVVWAPGHGVFAHVTMTSVDYATRTTGGELQVGLRRLTTSRPALTGTVTGVAPSELLFVTTQTTPLFYEMAGPTYATQVGVGVPFRVLAASLTYAAGTNRAYTNTFLHWALSPMQPATSADVTVDLDLSADTVTPMTTTGSFPIPAGAAGSFFATAAPTVGVYDDDTRMGALGMASSVTVAADGRSVDYTAEYVLPPGTVHPSVTFAMLGSSSYSTATIVGMPVDGPQSFTLLEPPVLAPHGSAFAHALDDVTIQNPAPTALLQAVVTSDDNGRIVLVGPVGARALHFPALPTGADRAVLLDGALARRVSLCVLDGPGLHNLCTLTASVSEIADP